MLTVRTTAASQPTLRGHQPLRNTSQAVLSSPPSNIEISRRTYDFLIFHCPSRFVILGPTFHAFSSPAYFSISFFWP